jgi:hypothetical protein
LTDLKRARPFLIKGQVMKVFWMMSVLALMGGCASSTPKKASPGVQKNAAYAAEGSKSPSTYQDCRQMRHIYVCRNDVEGQQCGCVEQKRVFGEFYSLFGPE